MQILSHHRGEDEALQVSSCDAGRDARYVRYSLLLNYGLIVFPLVRSVVPNIPPEP